MAKDSVKDRVTRMVRDVFDPAMRAAGFRRSGRIFWRDGPEVCHVAAISMDRWGSSTESSFRIQLGVFWHPVEELLKNPSVGKMPPPEYRCTFRIDLGRTVSAPPKPDWKATLNSDFDALGRDALKDLTKYGFRWFEYRSNLRHVLEWKRYSWRGGVQELVNADAKVVFKMMLGQREAAIADLRRFAENGSRQDALKLARRLRISTRELAVQGG